MSLRPGFKRVCWCNGHKGQLSLSFMAAPVRCSGEHDWPPSGARTAVRVHATRMRERGRAPGGGETGRRMRKRITLTGANQGARRELLRNCCCAHRLPGGTNGGFDEARTSVAQAETSFEDRLLQASKAAAPRVKMADSMDRPKRKSTLWNAFRGIFFRARAR